MEHYNETDSTFDNLLKKYQETLSNLLKSTTSEETHKTRKSLLLLSLAIIFLSIKILNIQSINFLIGDMRIESFSLFLFLLGIVNIYLFIVYSMNLYIDNKQKNWLTITHFNLMLEDFEKKRIVRATYLNEEIKKRIEARRKKSGEVSKNIKTNPHPSMAEMMAYFSNEDNDYERQMQEWHEFVKNDKLDELLAESTLIAFDERLLKLSESWLKNLSSIKKITHYKFIIDSIIPTLLFLVASISIIFYFLTQ